MAKSGLHKLPSKEAEAYQRGIKDERERCAKIADERAKERKSIANYHAEHHPHDNLSRIAHGYASEEAKYIARLIRRS